MTTSFKGVDILCVSQEKNCLAAAKDSGIFLFSLTCYIYIYVGNFSFQHLAWRVRKTMKVTSE